MSSHGTFDNLRLEPIPDAEVDAPLGDGRVRVALSAIAANFRDVMIALGLYPDPDAIMGIEASGVVIETARTMRVWSATASWDCSRKAPERSP